MLNLNVGLLSGHVSRVQGYVSEWKVLCMSLSAQSWHRRDRRKTEFKTMLYSYRITWMFFVIVHGTIGKQHFTLQVFEQFVALYMRNPDDKHLTQSGFETSTSEFRTTIGPNEPTGPATGQCKADQLIVSDTFPGESQHYQSC